MIIWNPWHGCHKISEGCAHCYMYFLDKQRGHDTSNVYKTANFDLPLKKDRRRGWKIKPGMEVHIGLSTDFFVEDGITYRIPDKQTQSAQAFKSGLSFIGRECHYDLRPSEGNLFEEPPLWTPHYRQHCATCGSRPVCSGCTDCGGCEA